MHLAFEGSSMQVESTVSEAVTDTVLAHGWNPPVSGVHWALQEADGDTRLTLTLQIAPGGDAARETAGFATHLDMLEAALAGAPIGYPFTNFKNWRAAFTAQLAAASKDAPMA